MSPIHGAICSLETSRDIGIGSRAEKMKVDGIQEIKRILLAKSLNLTTYLEHLEPGQSPEKGYGDLGFWLKRS